jgi:hypothetical protein
MERRALPWSEGQPGTHALVLPNATTYDAQTPPSYEYRGPTAREVLEHEIAMQYLRQRSGSRVQPPAAASAAGGAQHNRRFLRPSSGLPSNSLLDRRSSTAHARALGEEINRVERLLRFSRAERVSPAHDVGAMAASARATAARARYVSMPSLHGHEQLSAGASPDVGSPGTGGLRPLSREASHLRLSHLQLKRRVAGHASSSREEAKRSLSRALAADARAELPDTLLAELKAQSCCSGLSSFPGPSRRALGESSLGGSHRMAWSALGSAESIVAQAAQHWLRPATTPDPSLLALARAQQLEFTARDFEKWALELESSRMAATSAAPALPAVAMASSSAKDDERASELPTILSARPSTSDRSSDASSPRNRQASGGAGRARLSLSGPAGNKEMMARAMVLLSVAAGTNQAEVPQLAGLSHAASDCAVRALAPGASEPKHGDEDEERPEEHHPEPDQAGDPQSDRGFDVHSADDRPDSGGSNNGACGRSERGGADGERASATPPPSIDALYADSDGKPTAHADRDGKPTKPTADAQSVSPPTALPAPAAPMGWEGEEEKARVSAQRKRERVELIGRAVDESGLSDVQLRKADYYRQAFWPYFIWARYVRRKRFRRDKARQLVAIWLALVQMRIMRAWRKEIAFDASVHSSAAELSRIFTRRVHVSIVRAWHLWALQRELLRRAWASRRARMLRLMPLVRPFIALRTHAAARVASRLFGGMRSTRADGSESWPRADDVLRLDLVGHRRRLPAIARYAAAVPAWAIGLVNSELEDQARERAADAFQRRRLSPLLLALLRAHMMSCRKDRWCTKRGFSLILKRRVRQWIAYVVHGLSLTDGHAMRGELFTSHGYFLTQRHLNAHAQAQQATAADGKALSSDVEGAPAIEEEEYARYQAQQLEQMRGQQSTEEEEENARQLAQVQALEQMRGLQAHLAQRAASRRKRAEAAADKALAEAKLSGRFRADQLVAATIDARRFAAEQSASAAGAQTAASRADATASAGTALRALASDSDSEYDTVEEERRYLQNVGAMKRAAAAEHELLVSKRILLAAQGTDGQQSAWVAQEAHMRRERDVEATLRWATANNERVIAAQVAQVRRLRTEREKLLVQTYERIDEVSAPLPIPTRPPPTQPPLSTRAHVCPPGAYCSFLAREERAAFCSHVFARASVERIESPRVSRLLL